MTVDIFIEKMRGFQNYLQEQFTQDILVRYAPGLASDIAKRVQGTGRLGDGSTRKYSIRPTLVGASSFEKKSSFTSLIAQAKKSDGSMPHWVTIKKNGQTYRLILIPGGYAQIRELDGHLNSEKNYSRTKEMWFGFGLKEFDKTKVIIGGKTTPSQNKINWNSERDNANIIEPTQAEVDRYAKHVEQALIKHLNDSLRS